MLQDAITARFTRRLVPEDPPLCGGGLAFLMTCPRTAAHEETELRTVLKIPFRVRIPIVRNVDWPVSCASAISKNTVLDIVKRAYSTQPLERGRGLTKATS